MGRELRQAPVDYKWPRSYGRNSLVQVLRESLSEARARWDERKRLWDASDPEAFARHDVMRYERDSDEEYEERIARMTGHFAEYMATESFEDYEGGRPEDYPGDGVMWRPEDWSERELGWCIFQTVGEGSPITPVFATKEELVDFLVEHGTHSDPFGPLDDPWDPPMSRAAAEEFVHGHGFVPSMIAYGDGEVRSGLDIMEREAQENR